MIHLLSLLFIFISISGLAQENEKELLQNGSFESGNQGFFSDLEYSKYILSPGSFTITNKASKLNPNYKDPVGGDHTKGNGSYLVADFNTDKGSIVWKTKIEVNPDSKYRFKAYFCNLYDQSKADQEYNPFGTISEHACAIRLLVNGKEVGSTFYYKKNQHVWLETSVDWYSNSTKGLVEIAIKSENNSPVGNDLALDDISFKYLHRTPETKPKIENRFTLKTVNFKVGSSELLPESYAELDSLVTKLMLEPNKKVKLEGHTDNIGIEENLLKLSQDRVKKVKSYLVTKGIKQDRISTIGFGGSKPVADNTNEVTRKLNRRVEAVIY